jgi:hypothetical protein
VEVAGEVEVDILHRDYLCVAAAGRTAFDAEARTERRLAQRAHCLFADKIEGVGQTNRRRGLALAGWRRIDRGDEDQLAVFFVLQRLDVFHRDLGLVMAVGLKVLRRDAKSLLCDIHDALRFCGLGDFNIGLWILMLRGGHEDDPLLREIFVGNVWFVMPGLLPGNPRLSSWPSKTWMAGTSPATTLRVR